MIYGNKIAFVVLFFSFFLLVGCTNKSYYYELYDGYEIKNIKEDTKLYKDDQLFKINDLNYQISEFKYNSDVVCLKLSDNSYYMIYYVDGTIYGPFDLETLNSSVNSLSMTFDNDFTSLKDKEGLLYE